MRIAVHKFSSCDGCQLAFLNLGHDLLALSEKIEIVHFAEAGPVDPEARVDVAFVEGSITTPDERERIQRVRDRSRYVVSIGACATSGGLQALGNNGLRDTWLQGIYAEPDHIEILSSATPVSDHIRIDLELWGCPVSSRQVLAALQALSAGSLPHIDTDCVCMACKRRQTVCVLVTRGTPCMGAVTVTGCGALCPRFGRDCYGCYGPTDKPNTGALGRRFEGLGLMPAAIARRYLSFHSTAPVFADAGEKWQPDE